MSQSCSVVSCRRLPSGLCHCCNEILCLFHLNEHNDRLNDNLKNLNDFVNKLKSQIRNKNYRQIVDVQREKLEKWRNEAHRKIDEFFQEKIQQIDRFVSDKIDEFDEDLTIYQQDIENLFNSQQATALEIQTLNDSIEHLKREINEIDENFLQLKIEDFQIDRHLIDVRGQNRPGFGRLNLSSVYKIINVPQGSFSVVGSDKKSLLIHQAPNLCLIDQDLTIYKQVEWRHGLIYDICWSSTLNYFILITDKQIYLFDQTTMKTKSVDVLSKNKWFSCTCSEKFLFITTRRWNSSLVKIDIASSKPFQKTWQSDDICRFDEYIDCVEFRKNILAMVVRNKTKKTIRFDLSSAETLKVFRSVQLDIIWNPTEPVHFCSFIDDGWIIADYEAGRIIHLDHQGQIVSKTSYNSHPLCVSLFSSNRFVVVAKDGIHFHQLNQKKTYTISLV